MKRVVSHLLARETWLQEGLRSITRVREGREEKRGGGTGNKKKKKRRTHKRDSTLAIPTKRFKPPEVQCKRREKRTR